jgi:hypothetical protein
MSVHTLQETDGGGVVIGANIAKGEAPEAGRTILAFCHQVSGEPMPIVLDQVEVDTDTGYHQHGWSVQRVSDGRLQFTVNRYMEPDDALHFAAVTASFAAQVKAEPDPALVEAVAACIADEGAHPGGDFTNSSPEHLARLVIRRFPSIAECAS